MTSGCRFETTDLRALTLARACAIVAAIVLSALLAQAPAAHAAQRSASLNAPRIDSGRNLVVSGAFRAERGDRAILYLARRCASTLRAARRGNYVIASGRVRRSGVERFRGKIALRTVRPRRRRACLLVASSRGRTLARASRSYRVG